MYAIIETGGKQYKVSVGDVIDVEKLGLEVGAKVELKTLLVANGDNVDTAPASKVTAEVIRDFKGKKIIVFKFRAKKNSRRKNGHRQTHTKLRIVSIA